MFLYILNTLSLCQDPKSKLAFVIFLLTVSLILTVIGYLKFSLILLWMLAIDWIIEYQPKNQVIVNYPNLLTEDNLKKLPESPDI